MSVSRRSPRRHRRRVNPLAAITAAAAFMTGLLVAAHSAQEQAEDRPGAAASAVGVAAGAESAAGTTPLAIRYRFDGGATGPLRAAGGTYPLRILTAAG